MRSVETLEHNIIPTYNYRLSFYVCVYYKPRRQPSILQEAHQTVSEYRNVASSLHEWIREETSYMMSDRNFPPSISEMRKIAQESHRFRTEEIPPKYEEKRRLKHIYRDLQVDLLVLYKKF